MLFLLVEEDVIFICRQFKEKVFLNLEGESKGGKFQLFLQFLEFSKVV